MKELTPGHKFELANFEPNPHPASVDGPLTAQGYALCLAIEKLPASEDATALSVLASDLLRCLKQIENGNQVIQFIEKVPVYDCAPGQDPVPSGVLTTKNNGTTNEEVLAVLIARMNHLQGKFPCRENAIALTHFETGLLWLNKRTADRVARGVEGTHQK